MSASANLTGALLDLDDRTTVRGKDREGITGVTVLAVVEVRDEARAGATKLFRTNNEGNLFLDLNNSFAAVDERIDALSLVAAVSQMAPIRSDPTLLIWGRPLTIFIEA
uniref:DUF2326 domain-containing protein n=1 Tax=Haemonchus contortus TaxID=6289 RepID=A0A7I4Z253_HAECO